MSLGLLLLRRTDHHLPNPNSKWKRDWVMMTRRMVMMTRRRRRRRRRDQHHHR
jgi:hypothetical protein